MAARSSWIPGRPIAEVERGGSFIWARIIERSHTSASIRDLLIDEFQVDEATAQSDLSAFLDKLAARDLIEYASD